MSNKQVLEAQLPGWSGPFFPKAFELIQKRYAYMPARFNSVLFDDVADQMKKGRVINHPVTSDVKSRIISPWSHAVEFTRRDHMWRVFFPTALDSDRTDRTWSTRHIALYVKGDAPDEAEIELIGREFAEDFKRSYNEMYDRKS